MYSRAPRKFVADDMTCNPELGPASYNISASPIHSTIHTKPSYAPFTSLTPKISYFDTLVSENPSPLEYGDVAQLNPLRKKEPTALFGASHSLRFRELDQPTPGPGQYTVATNIVTNHLNISSNKYRRTGMDFGPLSSEIFTVDATEVSANSEKSRKNQIKKPISAKNKVIMKGKHIPVNSSRGSSAEGQLHPQEKSRLILWKRKHIPPSIPRGNNSFGYKETTSGDLVPRKMPMRIQPPEPEFVLSFAEKDKYESRGYSFAKYGENQDRLNLAGRDTAAVPGPGKYDAESAEKFLRQNNHGRFVPIMALAPTARMADELLRDSLKQSVPGPGAYETPILSSTITTRKGKITKTEKRFKTSSFSTVPGPGQYYPELSLANRAIPVKVKPFGSNTKRFADILTDKNSYKPAPGKYELDEVTSLASQIKHKLLRPSIVKQKPSFGSKTDRFKHTGLAEQAAKNIVPGPGAYETNETAKLIMATSPDTAAKPSTKVVGTLKYANVPKFLPQLREGLNFLNNEVTRDNFIDSMSVRVPVFGSQGQRFQSRLIEEPHPTPGYYDVIEAFQAVQKRGEIRTTSLIASKTQRVLFKKAPAIPGPGQYDPTLMDKKQFARAPAPRYFHVHSAILHEPSKYRGGEFDGDDVTFFPPASNNHTSHRLDVPGPESYTIPSTMVKKSFNVTIG